MDTLSDKTIGSLDPEVLSRHDDFAYAERNLLSAKTVDLDSKGLELAKVNRVLVAEGQCYVVECAVRDDGVTSPAAEFLDQLSSGAWRDDPEFAGYPDDAQIEHYDKFLLFCKTLADTGEPLYANAVNDLEDGIWEFKVGAKRLSFFDTPGDGTFHPKRRPRTAAEASTGKYYWFPDFDSFVRLGHAFPKLGQRTGQYDLNETIKVREEDLSHDG